MNTKSVVALVLLSLSSSVALAQVGDKPWSGRVKQRAAAAREASKAKEAAPASSSGSSSKAVLAAKARRAR